MNCFLTGAFMTNRNAYMSLYIRNSHNPSHFSRRYSCSPDSFNLWCFVRKPKIFQRPRVFLHPARWMLAFILPIRGAWQALMKVCVCPVRNASAQLLLFGKPVRLSGCGARLERHADVALKDKWWRSPDADNFFQKLFYIMCKQVFNQCFNAKWRNISNRMDGFEAITLVYFRACGTDYQILKVFTFAQHAWFCGFLNLANDPLTSATVNEENLSVFQTGWNMIKNNT